MSFSNMMISRLTKWKKISTTLFPPVYQQHKASLSSGSATAYIRKKSVPIPSAPGVPEPMVVQKSSDNFHLVGLRAFKEIKEAVEHMKDLNEKFKVDIKNNQLTIDTGAKGAFIFNLIEETQLLQVQSPYSGLFEYQYNPKENTWLSIVDNHDMRGLVTRDFVRYYVGCPKF